MFTRCLAVPACFEPLVDPRRPAGNHRHRLIDIMFLALCATICWCETWEDIDDFGYERLEWLRKYVPLENGVPHHDGKGIAKAAILLYEGASVD